MTVDHGALVSDAPREDAESDAPGDDNLDSTGDPTDDDSGVDRPTGKQDDSARDNPRRSRRRIVVAAALSLAIAAAATLAGVLYLTQYRPDQQTNDAAQRSVLKAATDGTVALLSYSPDTLDKDFAAARTRLTGDFLSYYNDFTAKVVAPAAREKAVTTTAKVARAAVSSISPNSAVVLVFINQTTTSTERQNPSTSASSVMVTLNKIDGNWLISSFDPV